ncbi:MAG: tetratricopeptide repeat protein [Gammaproteobacteria bacterium]
MSLTLSCSDLNSKADFKNSDQKKNSNTQNNTAEADLNADEKQPDLKQAARLNAALGIGYLDQGDVVRAKEKLFKAIGFDKNSLEANTALAFFYERIKDYPEAEIYHKKSLKISKASQNYGGTYNNYGAYLCRQNRYSEAEAQFIKALEDKAYSGTSDVYENYGLCAKLFKDYNKAERHLKTALDQNPSKYHIFMSLSDLYRLENKTDLAQAYEQKYKELALQAEHLNSEPEKNFDKN